MRYTLSATFGITLLFATILFSCSGNKEGMKGTLVNSNTILLDADTFRIQYHSSDYSMLFVRPIDNADVTMVMRQGADSLYYLKVQEEDVSPVYDTEDFVLVNLFYIYDIVNNKIYPLPLKELSFMELPFMEEQIYYLGDWNKEHLFSLYSCGYGYSSSEIIYFTDGTLIPLSEDAHALHIEKDGKIKIERRGLSITMDIDELHNYKLIKTRQEAIDSDMEMINEDYEEKSIPGLVDFRVDIEIPKGITKADKAIKRYIFQTICDDVFWNLDYDSKRLYSLSSIKSGDIRSALSQAAEVWRKEVRRKFSTCDKDSDYIFFSYYANVYKVAEGDNYVTYFHESDAFLGGAHSNPFNYYLTYDKQRDVIVDANNTIKKGMIGTFKEKVPKWVNEQYTLWCYAYDGELGGTYPCDEAGGCYSTTEGELHFPLPHFSIVPEGVMISFHPYQIDSFGGGNHDILIPKEDIHDCLAYDYWTNDELAQSLSYFIAGNTGLYYHEMH